MQDRTKKIQQVDPFNAIIGYLSLLETQQNILQAHRQALTTRPDFHPLSLFQYISRADPTISRRHIILLLEENSINKSQDEVKVLYGLYGYKEKMDFVGFLNYIYPSCTQPLKYISTVGFKKYSGIELQDAINEEIVCLAVMLLDKEIEFIQELENYKQQHFPRLSKNQIKKLIKVIKRKSESVNIYEVQSENVITFSEMRNCLRKAKNMNDNRINSICRKLSMNKDNFISLQQLEFWLKSWNKIRNDETVEHKPLDQDLQTAMIS